MNKQEQDQLVGSGLSIFNREFYYSHENYRQIFKQAIEHPGSAEFAGKLKKAMALAMADPEYDWKQAADKAEFSFYSDQANNDRYLLEIKLLAWDILFPDSVLSIDQLKALYTVFLDQVTDLSKNGTEWIDARQVIAAIKSNHSDWLDIELYDLMRAKYELDPEDVQIDVQFDFPNEWSFKSKNTNNNMLS